MKVNKNHYCALSRQNDFKNWLKTHALDLFNQLVEVQRNRSCRQNSEYMMIIYNEIYKRGKGDNFEEFVKKRFPYIIDNEGEAPKSQEVSKKSYLSKGNKHDSIAASNKHNVFKSYRPGVLTFPQKKIIVLSNRQQLEDSVKKFINNKHGVDYIIIEDHAYIEYFEPKYVNIVNKVPKETRDIHRYRLNEGLNSNN